ncbi:MAG TPA: 30S ribosomal protein S12 methylthiotransferase RimO [Terriglobales bacterium]|nr:30S ribosomal protein S12 methylthiotransferase RimO [Terriglobales bacterium]
MTVQNTLLAAPVAAPASSASQSADRSNAPTKVGFVSLGCPKNLVDSEVMMGLLAESGVELTQSAEDADVIVVNTCSFIDSAKQESVNTILEMAQHKLNGKAKRLVVAGCLVERYRNEIQTNIPEVDAVVGTGELEAILAASGITPRPRMPQPADSPFVILGSSALNKATAGTLPVVSSRSEGDARESAGRFSRQEWDGAIADLPNYLMSEHTPRVLATGKYSAYLKIAEGCDHPCTFCIIPQLRGKFRSRRFESVVAEAEKLVASGVRELVLIGQDTTCYGEDLGLKDGLALLLERLAQISDVQWVRFLYAYPNKITGKLLETIAANPKVCSYIDVPLQHAAPAVLKRMKRGAGSDIFLKSIAKMRATIPNLTLRTSFIVGFPGESAEDFDVLCDFVREAKFDWLGVFSYSDEDGSKAHHLDEKIAPKEIERRRKKLMQIQQRISKQKKSAFVGREFDLLVTGASDETDLLWEGRTEMHAPEIDGKVFINDFGPYDKLLPGQMVRCEITEAHDHDLVARVI